MKIILDNKSLIDNDKRKKDMSEEIQRKYLLKKNNLISVMNHDIWPLSIESPLSKSFSLPFLGELLFNFGICWDRGFDSDLDQCLTIMKR